jgi:hypothetical protein
MVLSWISEIVIVPALGKMTILQYGFPFNFGNAQIRHCLLPLQVDLSRTANRSVAEVRNARYILATALSALCLLPATDH